MEPVAVDIPLWCVLVAVSCLFAALVCGTVGQKFAALLATSGALLQVPLFIAVAVFVAVVASPDKPDGEGGGHGGRQRHA